MHPTISKAFAALCPTSAHESSPPAQPQQLCIIAAHCPAMVTDEVCQLPLTPHQHALLVANTGQEQPGLTAHGLWPGMLPELADNTKCAAVQFETAWNHTQYVLGTAATSGALLLTPRPYARAHCPLRPACPAAEYTQSTLHTDSSEPQ